MEVSRRDILVSLVAILILAAVLLPSLLVVNKQNSDDDLTNENDFSSVELSSSTPVTTVGINITTIGAENREGEGHEKQNKTKEHVTNTQRTNKRSSGGDLTTTVFEIRNPKVVQVSELKQSIPKEETVTERVKRILSTVPLIDGHNDFPLTIREHARNDVSQSHFGCDLKKLEPWASDPMSHTDLRRLRKGMVGGQFWSAYMDCDTQYQDAVQTFLEQVDVVHQLVKEYPDDLQWADSAAGIEAAFAVGKIASLVGVESGHAIGSSLAILRTLYQAGARYMTITHSCNTPWADAAQAESGDFPAENKGLSTFGEKVVLEMNRLGMMVDLAHVSSDTMRNVLNITKAPVIFSHSGARGVSNNVRNVPDDVLKMVKDNGGIVMANFYSCYIIDDCENNKATVEDVIKHINHIRKIAGVDHVGIGGDYNGVSTLPIGLEDVSGFPKVFEALINDKTFEWTDEDLEKLAGRNILGVFRAVERVCDDLALSKADNSWIDPRDFRGKTGCKSGL